MFAADSSWADAGAEKVGERKERKRREAREGSVRSGKSGKSSKSSSGKSSQSSSTAGSFSFLSGRKSKHKASSSSSSVSSATSGATTRTTATATAPTTYNAPERPTKPKHTPIRIDYPIPEHPDDTALEVTCTFMTPAWTSDSSQSSLPDPPTPASPMSRSPGGQTPPRRPSDVSPGTPGNQSIPSVSSVIDEFAFHQDIGPDSFVNKVLTRSEDVLLADACSLYSEDRDFYDRCLSHERTLTNISRFSWDTATSYAVSVQGPLNSDEIREQEEVTREFAAFNFDDRRPVTPATPGTDGSPARPRPSHSPWSSTSPDIKRPFTDSPAGSIRRHRDSVILAPIEEDEPERLCSAAPRHDEVISPPPKSPRRRSKWIRNSIDAANYDNIRQSILLEQPQDGFEEAQSLTHFELFLKHMEQLGAEHLLSRLRKYGSLHLSSSPDPDAQLEFHLWLLTALHLPFLSRYAVAPPSIAPLAPFPLQSQQPQQILSLHSSPATLLQLSAKYPHARIHHLPAPSKPSLPESLASSLPSNITLFPASLSLQHLPSQSFTQAHFSAFSSLPSASMLDTLGEIHRLLRPGGEVELRAVDALPDPSLTGPRLAGWMRRHLLPALRTAGVPPRPSRGLSEGVWDVGFEVKAEGGWKVPLLPGEVDELGEEVSKGLWACEWGAHVPASADGAFWWDDEGIWEECAVLGTAVVVGWVRGVRD